MGYGAQYSQWALKGLVVQRGGGIVPDDVGQVVAAQAGGTHGHQARAQAQQHEGAQVQQRPDEAPTLPVLVPQYVASTGDTGRGNGMRQGEAEQQRLCLSRHRRTAVGTMALLGCVVYRKCGCVYDNYLSLSVGLTYML
jgi:hypothetical protein